MPTTDPVIAFLDELQRLAEAMPEGPYEYGSTIIDEYGTTIWYPFVSPHADFVERYQAAYFASLDPDVVRALVRLARAMMLYPQGTSWADYDEIVAADTALRTLAAERVGGAE